MANSWAKGGGPSEDIDSRPLLADAKKLEWRTSQACPYGGWQLRVKRLFDLAVALFLLMVLSLPMLMISLLVRATSPGPVLFKQLRLGHRGKPFVIYKFRTMVKGAESWIETDVVLSETYKGNSFKLSASQDPRLTRVGGFMRTTSLDELPQLLNILKGEMSLVGPRPIVPEELECYGPWKEAYLAAVPGLTGRWQVLGRSKIGYPLRAEIDAKYVETWSLRADLVLLLRTLPIVFARHGAH